MQTRLSLIVALVGTAIGIGSFTNTQQANESTSRTELRDLLIQRRDVLRQLVDSCEQRLAEGLTQVDSVVAARGQLLDAELQLATTKNQRLEIYQNQIDNMRVLEDSLKIRSQAGETTLESLLSATAGRLQAEIDLAREKE